MFKHKIEIQSHKGPYFVNFVEDAIRVLMSIDHDKVFYIVDENILRLYSGITIFLEKNKRFIKVEAIESNKDLSKISSYIQSLVDVGIKRDSTLVVIGGGITQDITCFIATTLFRGIPWKFFPTTLLAQSDSCIGSKSSINVNGIKNLVGTFTPPTEIFIATKFLDTLAHSDILSGIGEMIKVHGIAGISQLQDFSQNYEMIISDRSMLETYIVRSLEIKKTIIEQDEFDKGIRNIMNYGHTFGHAIESASNYAIPHGVAVVIGQAMACHYSSQKGWLGAGVSAMALSLLVKNFGNSTRAKLQFDIFLSSIKKDKKNQGNDIALILPMNDQFEIRKVFVKPDINFEKFCTEFFYQYGFDVDGK